MKKAHNSQKLLTAERQDMIYKMVTEQRTVQVTELAEQFGVSVATIRRDLSEMEEKMRLNRVYGGAIAIKQANILPYALRTDRRADDKDRIGAAAAELINDGDHIFLDIGTTVRAVSKHLLRKNNIEVFTNNTSILTDFIDAPISVSTHCFGGTLKPSQHALSGSSSVKAIENFYYDKAVIGIAGIDIKAGLTSYTQEAAEITSAAIRKAKEVILVVDSSKFGIIKYVETVPLTTIDIVVTDKGLKPEDKKALEELGIRVIIA